MFGSGGFGTGGGGFGTPAPQQQSSPFGGTGFGAGGGSAFGAKPGGLFGTPTSTPGGFGTGSTGGGLFGSGGSGTRGFGTGGFGAPAPAPTPFGAAPATSTGGFGQAGGFGTSTASGAFGSSTGASPFGAKLGSSPFGTSGGTFATQGGGLFGTPASSGATGFGTGFGSTSTGGAFGASAAAPAGGAFGAPTGGAFGAPAAAPAGGAFGMAGGSAFGGAAATGTVRAAFQPTRIDDKTAGGMQSVLMSITAMNEYSGKSFEELRVEDYAAGRKTSASAGVTGGGAFGAASSFGQAGSTGFGGLGAGTSPFGAPAAQPLPFGAPAPAPTGGGLFGTAAPAAGAFGAFGTPAPQPGASLFSTTSPFGAAPAPSAFGSFGQPAAPAPTPFGVKPAASLFGPAPTPAGAFGAAQPAPASSFSFGTPAAAPSAFGGSLFAPAAAPSAFGAAPAAAPTPSFSFGTTSAPAPTGVFGAPSAAPSSFSFGTPTPAPATGFGGGGTGLFGAAPSGFGAPTPAPAPGGFGFATASAAPAPASSSFSFAATPATAFGSFGAPAKPAFGAAPAPSGSLFSGFGAPSAPAPSTAGSFGTPGFPGFGTALAPAAQQTTLQAQHGQNAYGAPGHAFGAGALVQKVQEVERITKQLEMRLEGDKPSLSASGASWREAGTPSRRTGFGTYALVPHSAARIKPRGSVERRAAVATPVRGAGGAAAAGGFMSPDTYLGSTTKRLIINTEVSNYSAPEAVAQDDGAEEERAAAAQPAAHYGARDAEEEAEQGGGQEAEHAGEEQPEVAGSAAAANGAVQQPVREEDLPKLVSSDYTSSPSIDVLRTMSAEELSAVHDFSMTHTANQGRIKWLEPVDLRGADLDAAVAIEPKAVAVYDHLPAGQAKPAVGQGLNRRARITLMVHRRPGASYASYERKLREFAEEKVVQFVSYTPEGEYTFIVDHFSRYEVDMDESDGEGGATEPAAETVTSAHVPIVPANVMNLHIGPREVAPAAPRESFGSSERRFNVDGMDGDQLFETSATVSPTQLPAAVDAMVADDDDTFHISTEPLTAPPPAWPARPQRLSLSGARREREAAFGGIAGMNASAAAGATQLLLPLLPLPKRALTASAAAVPVLAGGRTASAGAVPGGQQVAGWASATMQQLSQDMSRKATSATTCDAALQLGRSLRAGWGADGKLVVVTRRRVAAVSDSGSLTTVRSISVRKLTATPSRHEDAAALYQPALTLHLQHAKCSEAVLPERAVSAEIAVAPSWGLENESARQLVHDHISRSAELGQARGVPAQPDWAVVQGWRLVNALWGSEKQLEEGQAPADLSFEHRQRFVSAWLSSATADCLAAAASDGAEEPSTMAQILGLLSVHQIDGAAELAAETGLLRLSTLLAFAGVGNAVVRQEAVGQLAQLLSVDKNKYDNTAFTNALRLLSGEELACLSDFAPHAAARDGVQGLNWLRHLGLCLWYQYGGVELAAALARYAQQVVKGGADAPIARYMVDPTHFSQDQLPRKCDLLEKQFLPEGVGGGRGLCLLYRLMRLAVGEDALQPLYLDPLCCTPDVLDYGHAWHLLTVLQAMQVTVCMPGTVMLVSDALVSQLVGSGLWHWAAYVLLNIDDEQVRSSRVHDLVLRHGYAVLHDMSDAGLEVKQVLTELRIPVQWLCESTALWMLNAGNYQEAFDMFLGAGMVTQANKVMLRYLAPAQVCEGPGALVQLQAQVEALSAAAQVAEVPVELGDKTAAFALYLQAAQGDVSEASLRMLHTHLVQAQSLESHDLSLEQLTCHVAYRVMQDAVEHALSWGCLCV